MVFRDGQRHSMMSRAEGRIAIRRVAIFSIDCELILRAERQARASLSESFDGECSERTAFWIAVVS
jgi:hypothetical protein